MLVSPALLLVEAEHVDRFMRRTPMQSTASHTLPVDCLNRAEPQSTRKVPLPECCKSMSRQLLSPEGAASNSRSEADETRESAGVAPGDARFGTSELATSNTKDGKTLSAASDETLAIAKKLPVSEIRLI
mmetsp:Transcript_47817/g.84755  ORF Transcript_47817/g.84755 Transcript_47817/m.84755 type:complete len:130 (-) Transcript_47817:33-422(-)